LGVVRSIASTTAGKHNFRLWSFAGSASSSFC